MKKILAVLLAALFVVSMSTMAFAADPINGTVKTKPTKTEYKVDEAVNLDGLVIEYKVGEETKTATCTTETASKFAPTPAKVAKDTKKVEVTYTDGETVVKVSIDVTVKEEEKPKDEMKVAGDPTKTTYIVGEDLDLTGLKVSGTKNGEEFEATYSEANKSAFGISGFDKNKLGEQTVTVTYNNLQATFKVTVKDKDKATIVVKNAKGVYKVGEAFDENLTISYIPEGGKAENATTVKYTDGQIGVKGFNTSKVAEKVTVTVTYQGLEATYDIAVVEKDRLEKQTIVKDLWSAKNNLDKDPNATIADYVEAYTSVISCYMAADDLDDIAKYVDTQDKVQELVQDSSLYPDNWNEFVKVYTDYIPTAVNQQLDIAARLGWDASDQDFVQDIIDLVKGAAESDATTTEKAADNGGNGGSSSTDANPKTGSTSAIAVFAVLSVAAAAAVVCTKKKED